MSCPKGFGVTGTWGHESPSAAPFPHSRSEKIAPTLISGCRKSSDLVGESKLNVELVAGADFPELQWWLPSKEAAAGEEEKIFE
ncbi:hypothetical protein L484_023669 [Morus notabilis]|uniref:Uncharacterized protein n=1 Tax=Morus notabilis TaxID=981085 RepID=W9RE25_9ROSA|nr:hypothetical protein L484_023669 [Morus notabilis]